MRDSELSVSHFWAKVDIKNKNECWEWTGAKKPSGYGNVRVNGEYKLAHRMAWEISFFPVPMGMSVCHACDNRACCNPAHLMIGMPSANFVDMVTKGRAKFRDNKAIGERNCNSKLDNEKVRKIRESYSRKELSQYELANKYGVSQAAIGSIVRLKTWRHV